MKCYLFVVEYQSLHVLTFYGNQNAELVANLVLILETHDLNFYGSSQLKVLQRLENN